MKMKIPAIDFIAFAARSVQPINIMDRNLRFVYANNAYLAAVKRSMDELLGVYVFEAFPDEPERVEAVKVQLDATLGGAVTRLDAQPFALEDETGTVSTHYWQAIQEPIYGPDGKVEYLVQKAEDVTEQYLLREQNKVISKELDHRVKNMMAVTRSIARLSAKSAQSIEEYSRDFVARIDALSRTYTQLAQSDWLGLDLRIIIQDELSPFAGKDASRLKLEGPEVKLAVRSSKDVAMLIHELATNASKYGCFSTPTGRLDLRWTIDDQAIDIEWHEDGLSGIAPPSREGFGTKLMAMLPGIQIKRQFLDTGLKFTAYMPYQTTPYGIELSR